MRRNTIADLLVATLAWGLVDLGKRFKRLDDAILLLEMLIQKCYGGPGLATLSGVHAAFLHVSAFIHFLMSFKPLLNLQACLLTRRYQHAQPVIEGVYVDVKQASLGSFNRRSHPSNLALT